MKTKISIFLLLISLITYGQIHPGVVAAAGMVTTETPSTLLDGLTAWWDMDDASGAIQDATANNYDLTAINSPTYQATGKISYGVNFSPATSGAIRNEDQINVIDGYEIAISLWVNFNTLPSTSGDDAYLFKLGMGLTPYAAIYLYLDTDDDLVFTVYDVWGGSTVSYTTISVSTSTWYHIVAQSIGYNTYPQIWVNGSEVGNDAVAPLADYIINTASFVSVGQNYNGATEHADAIIDMVGIWEGRKLTNDEIAELYNSGNGSDYPF